MGDTDKESDDAWQHSFLGSRCKRAVPLAALAPALPKTARQGEWGPGALNGPCITHVPRTVKHSGESLNGRPPLRRSPARDEHRRERTNRAGAAIWNKSKRQRANEGAGIPSGKTRAWADKR